MMTTMQLNAELANQIKLLSGNTDLMKKALDYMKSLTVHMTPVKQANESERTKAFWIASVANGKTTERRMR